MEKATFAMGCFWGVEALFKKVPGVLKTTVGYTGGHTLNPNYEKVCTGTTGHAEAIEIEYDPNIVSYRDLINLFWKHHDPTTLNKQGPDVGEQYRSAVFYHSEEQKQIAEDTKNKIIESKRYSDDVVTEIVPAQTFYIAEEYHQNFAEKNPHVVCHIG